MITDHRNGQKEASRDIAAILAERGKLYGKFHEHAEITQLLKAIMSACPKWVSLQHDQHEALEMIAHKIGRILNGDPNYVDSWSDIAGYAQLVANRLSAPSVGRGQENQIAPLISETQMYR